MTLSRRQMLKALALGAAISAGGLLVPKAVLAATSRRPGTNETIRTLRASGGNFTEIATWESTTTLNLSGTSVTEVLECYADGSPYTIASSVAFTGATANATYRRIVRSAAGQGYNGIPGSGVKFASTGNFNMFAVTETNFQFQDITLELLTASGTAGRSALAFTSAGGILVGVLAKGVSTGNTNAAFTINGDGAVVVNCLAYECDGNGFRITTGAGLNTYLYNCTSIGNTNQGFSPLNAMICKNCLGSGNGLLDFDTGITMTNCASEDTSAVGTAPRINQTFTFVNAASDDYHLTTGDAGARGFGASLAADATFAFDDDVDRQTITTWSIGFDAPQAAPPPGGRSLGLLLQ